ncbi:MAG: PKD domain-containing protein, partial [Actinomycetota bacterium]
MVLIGAVALLTSVPPEPRAASAAPRAVAGGPYTIVEGDPLVLDGSAATDDGSDGDNAVTFRWDLDGDGDFDDADGPDRSVSWEQLVAAGIDDDGPHAIALQVDDGTEAGEATATVVVTNRPPTITVTAPATVAAGAVLRAEIAVSDPGADTVTGWAVHWGDGTVERGTGAPGTLQHTYAAPAAARPVTVDVTDEDGTWSSSDLVAAHLDSDATVVRLDPATTEPTGWATTAGDLLRAPGALVVGADGRLYVSGSDSGNVVRFDPTTDEPVEAFVEAGAGGLSAPTGLAFGPDGHLYVADGARKQVLRFHGETGAFIDIAVDDPALGGASGVLPVGTGTLLVADDGNDVVRAYALSGEALGVWAATEPGSRPGHLGVGPDGSVLVSLIGAGTVAELDPATGEVRRTFTPADGADDAGPRASVLGADGAVWVADYWRDRIERFDAATGAPLGVWVAPIGPSGPAGLAFTPAHVVRVLGDAPAAQTGQEIAGDKGVELGDETEEWLDDLGDPTEGVEFAVNDGDADADVDFAVITPDYDAVIVDGDVALVADGESVADAVVMEVVDATPEPTSALLDESPIALAEGASPDAETGPATGADEPDDDQDDAIEVDDVLPGVDVVYSADGDDVEYSFVIDPGAEPDDIVLDFDGTSTLSIEPNGDLLIEAESGPDYRSTAPITFQDVDGERVAVDSAYLIRNDGTVGFTLGAYDPTLPVVIDPTFVTVDTASGSYTSGSTIDLPLPSGAAPGDLLLAQIAYNATGGGIITPPSGWTLLDETGGNGITQAVYWRVEPIDGPLFHSFTLSSGATDTAAGAITAYDGVDTTSPIHAVAGQTNAAAAAVIAPEVTTTVPGATLVALFAVRDDGPATPPGGMAERTDVNSAQGGAAADETLAASADEELGAAGATGVRTATVDASAGSVGTLVALQPANPIGTDLVMVTGDGTFDINQDSAKKALFESFGWTGTAIDDGSPGATFTAAATGNDVMFV